MDEEFEKHSRIRKIGDACYIYKDKNSNNNNHSNIINSKIKGEDLSNNNNKNTDINIPTDRENINGDGEENNKEDNKIKKIIEKLINLKKNSVNRYFNYFITNLREEELIRDINQLFELNFIENDYKNGYEEFFKDFNLGELWQCVNNILMIKILIDLKENNKKIEESSLIYE